MQRITKRFNSNMVLRVFLTYGLVCCLFVLNGCATTDTEANIKAAAPRAPLDGIWTGEFEFDSGNRGQYDFTAVHLAAKAYAFSQRAKAVCIGSVQLQADNYASEYVLYALDGGPFDVATLTGKLTEGNKIASRFVTQNGGESGVLELTYNPIYNLPSSLSATQGGWSYTDGDGLTTEFLIQEAGTITGHDSIGCAYQGHLSIIDPSYNAYQIQVEITACGSVGGNYAGISFMQDRRLNVHLVNRRYGLFFAFSPKGASEQ